MTFDLDPGNPTPLYLQLVEAVRRWIVLGALRPGDRVPPVRDLAREARVNRNTAARAVQELEAQGIVRTRVGQGTFVVDGAMRAAALSAAALLDDAMDHVIAEASGLGIPLDELPRRLEQRIRKSRAPGKENR